MLNESALSIDEVVLGLTPCEERLIRAAFIRGTDKLRATQPYRMTMQSTVFGAAANYVWQRLYTSLAGSQPHKRRAVYAGWFLFDNNDERQREKEILDRLILQVESVMTPVMRRRIQRWTWRPSFSTPRED